MRKNREKPSDLSLNRADFDALMVRHGPTLRVYLSRRLPTRDDAEDVYQQTCLSAWQHLEQCQQSERFRAWLLTIAANKVRDLYRERVRTPRTSACSLNASEGEAVSDASTPVGDTDVAAQVLDRQAFAAATDDMVRLLAEEYSGTGALIAWRRWIDGWSSREIAEAFRLTPNAVDQRLYQMRKRLRHSEELRGLLLEPFVLAEGRGSSR